MKHATGRVRGRSARFSRVRNYVPLLLCSAAAVGGAFFCAPHFSALAQTGLPAAPTQAPRRPSLGASAPRRTSDPSIKTTFPVAEGAPMSFASDASTDYNAPAALTLPLSRIKEDANGNATATQWVNRITSAALAADGSLPAPDQPLWLGTQYGVKRVQNQTARYYTPDDGLPGAYVEAVANDAKTRAAWCLVRSTPLSHSSTTDYNQTAEQIGKAGRLAFCQWDSRTDTWRAEAEIVVPGPLANFLRFGGTPQEVQNRLATRDLLRWQGKAKIAQSGRFVAFASSVSAQNADALVYLWDKKAQKLRPLGWETDLKNDTDPFVGVSFLHIDDARQTLWVGTSQGLFARPLDEKGKWRAYLTGRTVSAGAISGQNKNALYVACKLPGAVDDNMASSRRTAISAPGVSGQRPAPVAPDWRLLRIALSTGEATELPTPPSVDVAAQRGFYSNRPAEPTGLFVDGNRAVWVTLLDKFSPFNDFTWGQNGSDENQPRGLDRFDLAAKTWAHLPMALPPNYRNGLIVSSEDEDAAPPPAQEAYLKQLDAIPVGTLAPLTFTLQPPGATRHSVGLIQSPYPRPWTTFAPASLPPEFWIEHRFPHWYGASNPAAQNALAPMPRGYVVADVDASGSKDAPPNARLWTVRNEDTLVSFSRAEATPYGDGIRLLPGFHWENAEAAPLQITFSDLQTPLLRVVSASAANPSLLVGQGRNNFFLIDPDTKVWEPIFPPDTKNNTSIMESYYTALVPPVIGNGGGTGDNGPLMQLRRGQNEPVRRWNTTKRVWETDTRLPVPENSLLLGPGAGGAVWFSSDNNRDVAWYQEPAAPGSAAPLPPLRVAPPLPAEWRVPGAPRPYETTTATRPIAARGSHVYYVVSVRGDFFNLPTSTGEDIGEYNPSSGNTAYIGSGRLSATSSRNSLAGYDIVTKKWTAPLPLPRDGQGQPNLLFSGDQTYAATTAGNANGSVWQWNQTRNTWDGIAPPLPPEPGLFEQEEKPRERPVVPVAVSDRYVWVLALARMMARYDRMTDKWETVSLPAILRGEAEETAFNPERQARAVAIGPDRFCVSSDKGGLWLLRVLPGAANNKRINATWEMLGQSRTVRSRPIEPPPAPGSTPRPVSPPRQAEFYLSNLTVTPRFVWVSGSGSGGSDQVSFVARWNKAEKTWTTWNESRGLPLQGYINDITADGDSIWVIGDGGTYRYNQATDYWDLIARSNERYGALYRRQPPRAPSGKTPFPALNGQVMRIALDTEGAFLLLTNVAQDTPGALVWRWNRADNSLHPLPFPEKEAGRSETALTYLRAVALLNEPGVLWVGTTDGLWAWDKKAQTWSKPALPAFAGEIVPNQIARSENALLLFGQPVGDSERGIPQAVRLTAPPFAKRP